MTFSSVIQFLFLVLISAVLLSSCIISDRPREEETTGEVVYETPLDTLALQHASLFGIEIFDGYKLLHIYNKNNEVQQSYLLYRNELPPTDVPHDLALRVPLERVVSRSTKYAAFISLLEAEDKLVGFVGSQYVSDESIREKIKTKKIAEVGNNDGSAINFEMLIETDPDAIFTYDASLYAGNSDSHQKMKELGLPVIICNETLEKTPLAQAEWIKVFGALLGKEQEAKQIFEQVSSRYDSLKSLVKSIPESEKPTLFFNTWYNETWFMPSGESYVAQFAQDAGAKYLWNDLEGRGASPLSIESVYDKASEADYWFHPSDWMRMNQLISADRRFVEFRSVKESRIFNHTKRGIKGAGNDYFESGVAFPDKILEDWIKILHPDKIENSDKLYFYERLRK